MHSHWHKSSYSGDRSNCVEVTDWSSGSAVRDSTRPNHTHLTFETTEWQAFLTSLRRGEL